jgi:hypothetical protein
MSRQDPRVLPLSARSVSGTGGGLPAFSRRKFLGMSGTGVLVASTPGWLFAPTPARASGRCDPYDIATWQALAGARLTLRQGSDERSVVAHHPVKGSGHSYTVVLGCEGAGGHPQTSHDGTYELDHELTGRFLLFVVDGGPGRYVATFSN